MIWVDSKIITNFFFLCSLHFSAIVIIKWLNSATLGATKTYSIIGLVLILTVFLIVKMNGFEELISIAVCSPMGFPISGAGPAFIAVFIFLSITVSPMKEVII